MLHRNTPRFVLFFGLLVIGLAAVPSGVAESENGPVEADAATEAPRFVAYYFHGNRRCATCRKLEAYSEEAITKGFVEEIESGALAWRTVNTDEAEHQHFVEDFELVTKSLVLAEYRDGEVERFANLKLVWQLVGDKDGFIKYVRDSTRDFLDLG